MSSNQIRVADYLMRHIASLGVDCVFLLPGGGAMHVNDAIACEPRLLAIPCHHEQACGIAAEAYGRTHSCGFGVAVVTTGPGATNMVTPVAGAWIESLPMLVISGQVKRVDALNGRSIRQGGVQEVDIISVIKPITKHAVTLNRPEDARKCLEEALFLMKSGRPGPVWIDVPLDIQAATIDPDKLKGFVYDESKSLSRLNESISEVNRLLESSTRPMFLIGHGVRISDATDTFARIAKSLGIPCAFTWNAADTLDWEHELYVGRPGVVAARAPNFAIQNCDCLISIGCRIDNIVTAYNPENFARSAQKVVVDVDPNELERHTMPIKVKVCADALEFLAAWESDLPMMGNISAWRLKCADWKTRYPPLDGRSFDQSSPIGHFQLVDRLSDAIGKDRLVITGSSGLAVEVFYTAFRNKVGQRLFLTSGLGAMGYGLPASIGACLGSGKRQTVCIESDGSLMLNLQELATLKQLNLPITLVIMNNNGYASIRNTQRNYFNERYIGSGKSSGLWIPDFIQLATAMGIPCLRVTDIEQINAALFDDSLKVVEVILKEDETLSPKVSAMPQADGSIISMPLEDMSPLLPRAVLRQEMLVPLHPLSEKIDG